MRIEYFDLSTGDVDKTHDYLLLNGNEVWRDNYRTYESQSCVVDFDNFIVPCPGVGWRVVE